MTVNAVQYYLLLLLLELDFLSLSWKSLDQDKTFPTCLWVNMFPSTHMSQEQEITKPHGCARKCQSSVCPLPCCATYRPSLHCPVPTSGEGEVGIALLPALWPIQTVYGLLPSDLGCILVLPGCRYPQETRCEAGLWRSEQKTQSQDVCSSFFLTLSAYPVACLC